MPLYVIFTLTRIFRLCMDNYKGKVLHDNVQFNEISAKDTHVFKSLDDMFTYQLEIDKTTRTNQERKFSQEDIAQLDMKEQLHHIIEDMQTYWTQFGFMNCKFEGIANIVNRISKHIILKPVLEGEENDNQSLNQDEQGPDV